MGKINYTIIIPHKNSPELLRRCVESIPFRDDIQVLVMDDNSDEGKKPLLSRVGLEVIYIDADHSKGAGRARNLGLAKAKGRWLLFADADDFYTREAFAVFDEYKDSEYQVVFLNSIFVNNETLEPLKKYPSFLSIDQYDGSQYTLDKIKYVTNVPWAKMVRRDFQQKYNMQFEETTKGNDIFFSYQVGIFSQRAFVDKRVVYVYTRNSNSISHGKKDTKTYLQSFINRSKIEHFMRYIGHPEWITPTFVFWGRILRSESILFCLWIIMYRFVKYKIIKEEGNKYVEYFKNNSVTR